MSPGIAHHPGSPGTYRRKSSTTLPPDFSKGTTTNTNNSRRSSLSQVLGDLLLGQQQSQPSKMANDNLPGWPNTKEDYELKEVIGKCGGLFSKKFREVILREFFDGVFGRSRLSQALSGFRVCTHM